MRTGDFKQTYGELVTLIDLPPVWLWSAVLVAALIVAPFVLNSYALSFLMIILITVVGALGLNILTGYTGLISLGHVGFLVTGAYAYAVLVSKYHMHPLVGFLGAGVVPALASLIVGAPSLRLKGLYLAITTLAFSFIINTVILEARWLTKAPAAFRCSGRRFSASVSTATPPLPISASASPSSRCLPRSTSAAAASAAPLSRSAITIPPPASWASICTPTSCSPS